MGALIGRWRLLRVLWRNGRLAWRLFRDRRTPLRAKAILVGTVVLMVSPINWIPNAIPLVGELEDAAIFSVGLELFFKAVPTWLRAEHEARMGMTREGARVVVQQ